LPQRERMADLKQHRQPDHRGWAIETAEGVSHASRLRIASSSPQARL